MKFNEFIINDEVIFDVNLNRLTPVIKPGEDKMRHNREDVVLNLPTARCLLLFLENPSQIVSRETFLSKVWGERGVVVSQNTFYQNISLLRKSLSKAGLSKEVILTIRRKGFVLASDITITRIENHEKDVCRIEDKYRNEYLNNDKDVLSPVHFLHDPEKEKGTFNKKYFAVPSWVLVVVVIIILCDVLLMAAKFVF